MWKKCLYSHNKISTKVFCKVTFTLETHSDLTIKRQINKGLHVILGHMEFKGLRKFKKRSDNIISRANWPGRHSDSTPLNNNKNPVISLCTLGTMVVPQLFKRVLWYFLKERNLLAQLYFVYKKNQTRQTDLNNKHQHSDQKIFTITRTFTSGDPNLLSWNV